MLSDFQMTSDMPMKIIGHIHSDFTTKFGIPRQSGIVNELTSMIIFEPEYRRPEAFRGIEEFSHLWLIWIFSETIRDTWSPTVRPPKLGGNVKKGVFATRSPFRPNPIGLSCVTFEKMETHPEFGPVLYVKGADLMNGTPILDIKPYLPYTESHPAANGSFSDKHKNDRLKVVFPDLWLDMIPESKRAALTNVLACDPRPGYQNDPERIYGFEFCGFDIRFKVDHDTLTVCEIVMLPFG